MPKVRGVLGRVEGTMDEFNFYQRDGETFVRRKGGVNAARIASDPVFERTRENNFEFGHAAQMGKLIRDGIRPLIRIAADSLVVSRITKAFTIVKSLDLVSPKGERKVSMGMASAEGKAIFKNFEFNTQAPLGSVLFKPFNLNTSTGVLTIPNLVTGSDIEHPVGATHVRCSLAWSRIDFEAQDTETVYSNAADLPINMTPANVTLTPTSVPTGSGINFFFLEISFLQEVNGVKYALKNKAFNAMKIIEVL